MENWCRWLFLPVQENNFGRKLWWNVFVLFYTEMSRHVVVALFCVCMFFVLFYFLLFLGGLREEPLSLCKKIFLFQLFQCHPLTKYNGLCLSVPLPDITDYTIMTQTVTREHIMCYLLGAVYHPFAGLFDRF